MKKNPTKNTFNIIVNKKLTSQAEEISGSDDIKSVLVNMFFLKADKLFLRNDNDPMPEIIKDLGLPEGAQSYMTIGELALLIEDMYRAPFIDYDIRKTLRALSTMTEGFFHEGQFSLPFEHRDEKPQEENKAQKINTPKNGEDPTAVHVHAQYLMTSHRDLLWLLDMIAAQCETFGESTEYRFQLAAADSEPCETVGDLLKLSQKAKEGPLENSEIIFEMCEDESDECFDDDGNYLLDYPLAAISTVPLMNEYMYTTIYMLTIHPFCVIGTLLKENDIISFDPQKIRSRIDCALLGEKEA